jgi:hypothetical protein
MREDDSQSSAEPLPARTPRVRRSEGREDAGGEAIGRTVELAFLLGAIEAEPFWFIFLRNLAPRRLPV